MPNARDHAPHRAFATAMRTVLLACTILLAGLAEVHAAPSIAFYYGADAPLDELHAFDIAVVDPDHGADPLAYGDGPSRLYAYVAVGEASPTRSWFKDLSPSWQLTANTHWGSAVLDLSQPQWRTFLLDRVFAPLWQRGYRGFFLDALDSYRLAAGYDEAAQQQGLVDLIRAVRSRFPGAHLVLNRGFEVVPKVKDAIEMVVAESLFRGWDPVERRYVEVAPAARDWLLAKLIEVRDRDGVPVAAIDYVDPADRAAARRTAAAIQARGIVPWVADGALASLGVGAVEVMPRKVLLLYDSREAPAINYSNAHRYLAMPLNYLGYTARYVDINGPLPDDILPGRYAGIVAWFSGYVAPSGRLLAWLRRQIDGGMRVAVLGSFGMGLAEADARALGLKSVAAPAPGPLKVTHRDRMLAFETEPRPSRQELEPLRLAAPAARSLLHLEDTKGAGFDAAALTAWGGYVLNPFAVLEIPGTDQLRWVLDPFAFLKSALALPDMPVPDVTTENGRRLMFAHIDGDGFPSHAELPGSPFAGEVLLERVLDKYRIPTTMSVIEAEVAADGLHPADSPRLEEIARRIFRLPHVEIASHSFSHPFIWDTSVRHGQFENRRLGEEYYHLEVPGYHRVDLRREIAGSIDYIQSRLAPAGKTVRLFQWSGDAAPGADALAMTAQAGVLNLNGGDTLISRANPTLTSVAGLGIEKGGVLQVYAPIANENRYTNLWHGPFYGYRSVIDTLRMTDAPRRLKPIDLYFHVYSATKQASLAALDDVYRWALAQPSMPIFASEYALKVQDYYHLVIARRGDGWLIRGHGDLRTLRAPSALGLPDLSRSPGVAGYAGGVDGNYIHLGSGEAQLTFGEQQAQHLSYLATANGRLESFKRADGHLILELRAYVPLQFALADSRNCTVSGDGRPIHGRIANGLEQFQLDHDAATIDAFCQPR
jgi:hypothetical protein